MDTKAGLTFVDTELNEASEPEWQKPGSLEREVTARLSVKVKTTKQ